MVKQIKKTVATALAIIICVGTLLPATGALAAVKCNCDEIPIIYVRGRASIYKEKTDCDSGALGGIEDSEVESAAKSILPVFAKAVVTDDYDEYCKQLVSIFEGFYDDFTLNENGEITNNSGIEWTWSESSLLDRHRGADLTNQQTASEYLYRFFYQYDCRLSPCENADGLHEYIEAVKRVTGHDKVNILARCLGCNVASAYFDEYGWGDINTVVLYNSIASGTAVTDCLFTGEWNVDADAVEFFVEQQESETELMDFLRLTISLYNKTYGLPLSVGAVNKLVTKIAKQVSPDVLKVSYGSMPGFWSMVSADKYEQARDFVFAEDADKYAVFINKIDEWHNNVAVDLEDMYKQMEADGVKIDIIAKYGYQLYPITEDADRQSDTIVTLAQQSFGGTAAPLGKTLSSKYIETAKAAGTDKYISPDKIVDASTGLFPDTTWYVKNFEHNCFPEVVDLFIMKLFVKNGISDVWSDENYPQYFVYNGKENKNDSLTAMTQEAPGFSIELPGYFETFIALLKQIMLIVVSVLKAVAANSAA